MLTQAQFERLNRMLPILQESDQQMKRELMAAAIYARIPAGRDVFVEGDSIDAIALLLSGVVRVYKIGETGREITLYRFGHGESCILTANAILSRQSFPAIATVEKDAEAILVPADSFRTWVSRDEVWRDFVFDLFAQRLASVIAVVEEVAFRRMDGRVAALLLHGGEVQNPLRITHQQIAAELGSSREVISRLLEDFASRGLIRTQRGRIEILDYEGLKDCSVM
jgi:CRP/FNR family transcriptional regulator, anaerobic regulatory protein